MYPSACGAGGFYFCLGNYNNWTCGYLFCGRFFGEFVEKSIYCYFRRYIEIIADKINSHHFAFDGMWKTSSNVISSGFLVKRMQPICSLKIM